MRLRQEEPVIELEISAEAKGRRLNRAVAVTVVALSVFMGLSKIRDDNIVQAMQVAKSDAVDTWNEYQATKIKLHIVEVAQAGGNAAPGLVATAAKYRAELPPLERKAKEYDAAYDALNVHDDQFDASDALMSIAVSVAAVAALVDTPIVLVFAWIFAAAGAVFGVAGFTGSSFHPAVLGALLGG